MCCKTLYITQRKLHTADYQRGQKLDTPLVQIPELSQRRYLLLYIFEEKYLFLDQLKHLFPFKERPIVWKQDKTNLVKNILPDKTERFKNSIVPYFQNILLKKSTKKI